MKRRLASKLEDVYIDIVDRTSLKYPLLVGLVISVSAFILLFRY